jgi:integrase
MRGHIEKRVLKHGFSYRIRWDVGGDIKRSQATQTFKTRKEAEMALAALLKDAHQGTAVVQEKRTVGELLMHWVDTLEPKVRPATLRRYRDIVNQHLIPHIGNVSLTKLTPLHVERLYAKLLNEGRQQGRRKGEISRQLSEGTVELIHIVLHRALRQGVRWGWIYRNVTEMVDAPKRKKREFTTWDVDQVAVFLIAARADDFAALWPLAVFSGLRRGELLGLKWEDLDLTRGTLSVRRTYSRGDNGVWEIGAPKTDSSYRQLALPRLVVEALRAHRTHQLEYRLQVGATYKDRGFVFTTFEGRPLHVNSLLSRFNTISKRAGLPRLRFHDLRHTSATLSLADGTHPKIVQERLGHSSIAMTMDLYSHVAMSLGKEEADRLERMIQQVQGNDEGTNPPGSTNMEG